MPVSLREDTEKMLYERERAHLEVMEIRAKCRRSKEAVHQALELQGELFRVYVKGQMHPEEEGREEEADNGVEGEESEEDEDAGVKEEDFEEEEKH
ncbi:hypothetical protein O3P69_004945 [Scylla paramamosain]|uniref:Uncharacterized protein n=1 Tax=Scylla paramamosain TaxID=85552 RepID=A0AAW0UCD7_SCYPA